MDPEGIALHEATRHRYLNYAMSVITARALPDLRDGLKPVQRRILYAMYVNLRLLPGGRYRKSAAVVGEVMAKYHPHGDSAIYEAMVRMAQPFSLRHPLVDGQGNFGSLDGDPPAAMRYTEARLLPIAEELLSEIKQRTVDFRPTYDGQGSEPIVLPAQFPQLLVNGSEGIAVGMATRIPPHNLREVIDATIQLIDEPDSDVAALCKKLKAPDFPTGGVILSTKDELREIYETGSGPVRLRGKWTTERKGRRWHAVITEIPYGVVKSSLVEKIGELVATRKVPQLTDVRDESTDEVRIVLELRKQDDAEAAMAYLFKRTELQRTYHVNLTCLVPGEDGDVPAPARLDLLSILEQWRRFRFQTVVRRFEFELAKLRERIHILEGFARIFDCLDEAIQLIRTSEGKRDAAERLMDRFDLDEIQADAILELRLYKIARLEILAIIEELEDKRAQAERIEAILASDAELWDVVKNELLEVRQAYGEARRSTIGGEQAEELTFSESEYIVAETAYVIVTRDGWIKRQGSFTDLSKIRIRDGDAIGWIAKATTTSTVTLFGDQGAAYVLRVDALQSTTGYGEPVQRHFSFGDGERVVGVVVHDKEAMPKVLPSVLRHYDDDENPPPPHGIAVTRLGRVNRFPISLHAEVSTKNGRRYMRPEGAHDRVIAVYVSDGTEFVGLATEGGNALCYPVWEVGVRRGAGKGMQAIKLGKDDRVLAFELSKGHFAGATVRASNGTEIEVRASKFMGKRGNRGTSVFKRFRFVDWDRDTLRYDLLREKRPAAEDGADEARAEGFGEGDEAFADLAVDGIADAAADITDEDTDEGVDEDTDERTDEDTDETPSDGGRKRGTQLGFGFGGEE